MQVGDFIVPDLNKLIYNKEADLYKNLETNRIYQSNELFMPLQVQNIQDDIVTLSKTYLFIMKKGNQITHQGEKLITKSFTLSTIELQNYRVLES